MDDRQALRGRHLRAVLLHPQDHPVDRWRRRHLGLAIGGYLSATAIDPNPIQPESAIFAIKFTIGLLPAICAIIAMLIFWKYPLSDKLFRQIRDENEAKKAELGAEFTGAANA